MAEPIRSNLFGELRRFARTSGAVGGIAARVASERLFGVKPDHNTHAEGLKTALGGLKGPLMKVAQFLSTVPDALPAEYAEELSQLQAHAPPMGWNFVRRRMASELGPRWRSHFESFSESATAAASLGQVHRASLKDGTGVACKLQYPDMPSTVEADLRQLRVVMAIYHRMDNAIQNDEIYRELAARLREELDYLREASNMLLYGPMLQGEPLVHVPRPFDELCTTRLLTMTWLQGRALQDRVSQSPPQQERDTIARALFRAWYVPLYRFGVIHGDPHLGNYQIREDGTVNLLDYGSIRVFHSKFVAGVIDLYKAIRDGDDDLAHHAYESWGFTQLSRGKMEVLNDWARFLYEPLLDDRPRLIQVSNDPSYGRDVAERVHAGLKRLGGVRPPREFVLMDRSAIGLGSVFLRLRARLNWSRMFHELIDDFNQTDLQNRQAKVLAAVGLTADLVSA
jgi:predicted unusual protein kinase regulating ubiquinone biosynthesis (AarF/ABC1/UbiB family)